MYKKILRAESAFIFIFLLVLYHKLGLSWKSFFLLILAPDVFMVGYLKDPKLGAYLYNLGHNYAVPVVLAVAAMATNSLFLVTLSIIWVMHIAIDRAMGLGLKSVKGFKKTHLN